MKKIVLARPNRLIVAEMKSAIEECNYQPVPLNELKDLEAISRNDIGGYVISTAVTSTIKADFATTLAQVQQYHRDAPIVFATLMRGDKALRSLRFQLKKLNTSYDLLTIERLNGNSMDPKSHALVVHKDDLVSRHQDTCLAFKSFFQ
jgi:hypothetical protein